MSEYDLLSLTTDYGLTDGFVAACHGGVIARAPRVRILDITHTIPPGDIRRGAAVLAQTVTDLPPAVHVAVVDPGVGTTRSPVAIEAGNGLLVGPDNGLLMWAAQALGGAERAMALTNSLLHRHPTSHTFHGRDIFAPVAAALCSGTPLEEVGDPVAVAGLVRLPEPHLSSDDEGLDGEVLTVDRFGNVQLAAPGDLLNGFGEALSVNGYPAVRGDMFAATDTGGLVVIIDSADRVAIAQNGGSAADHLDLRPGDRVKVSPR